MAGTSQSILIVVDKPTEGAVYRVDVNNLPFREGGTLSAHGSFIHRKTKTDSALKFFPVHFNTQPDSTIRQVITAMTLSDDIIGGTVPDEIDEIESDLTYGAFVYGAGVYGPTTFPIRVVAEDTLEFQLGSDFEVVVGEEYLNPDNYTVTLVEGDGEDVNVRKILKPEA